MTFTVNPFWFGVACTLGLEILALFVAAIVMAVRQRGRK